MVNWLRSSSNDNEHPTSTNELASVSYAYKPKRWGASWLQPAKNTVHNSDKTILKTNMRVRIKTISLPNTITISRRPLFVKRAQIVADLQKLRKINKVFGFHNKSEIARKNRVFWAWKACLAKEWPKKYFGKLLQLTKYNVNIKRVCMYARVRAHIYKSKNGGNL